MSDEQPEPPATLPYAGGSAGDASRRVSRLAIASIPAGVLCCPCLLSAIVQPIMTHLPRTLIAADVFSWLRNWSVVTLMATATAVPVAALVRVWTSQGRRTGTALATAGLVLSLTWWLLYLLIRFGIRWAVAPG